MQCFLHIGTEKTATSTIQSFLNLNREKLYEYGYLYPKSVGIIDQYKLPVAAYELNRRDDLTMICDAHTNDDLLSCQEYIISDLKRELESQKKSKVIFSSEHLQSRLTTLDEIKRLKTILNKLGFNEIAIVVYLRNPSELANSLYSTDIKVGSTKSSPPMPNDSYYFNVCHHKNTLEKFGGVFGKSALIPRVFSRQDFKGGSIIADFLEILGLSEFDDYIVPKGKNQALSSLSLEILRRLNSKVPRFIDKKENLLRDYIVYYFESCFSSKGKYIMSQQLFKEYDDAFKESNEWVRSHYFPNKKSLFPIKKYPAESELFMTDQELDWIAEAVYSIWFDKRDGQESFLRLFARKVKLRIIAILIRFPFVISRLSILKDNARKKFSSKLVE